MDARAVDYDPWLPGVEELANRLPGAKERPAEVDRQDLVEIGA